MDSRMIHDDEKFRSSIKNNAISDSKALNREKRMKLFDLDEDACKEAKEGLEAGKKGWYVFEGRLYPDLFIESETHILVIEGKRTEASTTKNVKYLSHRSQMARHIENAIGYCEGKKKVIAFYIVEEDCGYEDDCKPEGFRKDFEKETVRKSEESRKMLADSFYGYTTWQAVSKSLDINFDE